MRNAAIVWMSFVAGSLGLGACNLITGQSKLSYTGGTGGGTPAGCDPTMLATAVPDTCGVFVSDSLGSDTSGRGTKQAPYQTLGTALSMANGTPVYACGEPFTVKATVTLSARVDLYGALDCTNGWVYDKTKKTRLAADLVMTPIPLAVETGASGSSVHDFSIAAADAVQAGGSSIAVLDSNADLALVNVDVTAGAGKDGAPGAAPMPAQMVTPATANGQNGSNVTCAASMNMGGAGGTNACNGTSTNGGSGGDSSASSGEPGGNGLPVMTPGNGGAAGQTCTAGAGAAGTAGTAGTGARGIGDISSSGYQAPASAPARAGNPGQGGGGGGGASPCAPYAGPSGGGGGAGGCGGAPGNPGMSGGSSIGILALGAGVKLTNVTITTQAGGAGGHGGNGQLGAAGGQPGIGYGTDGCNGGNGGQGGAGGPGGGGAGGHSVGIAIKGTSPPSLSNTTITPESQGAGGAGGDGTAQTKGDDGKACKILDFSTATCTM